MFAIFIPLSLKNIAVDLIDDAEALAFIMEEAPLLTGPVGPDECSNAVSAVAPHLPFIAAVAHRPVEHSKAFHRIVLVVPLVPSAARPFVLALAFFFTHHLSAFLVVLVTESFLAWAVFSIPLKQTIVSMFIIRPHHISLSVSHSVLKFPVILAPILVNHLPRPILIAIHPFSNVDVATCIFEYSIALLFPVFNLPLLFTFIILHNFALTCGFFFYNDVGFKCLYTDGIGFFVGILHGASEAGVPV